MRQKHLTWAVLVAVLLLETASARLLGADPGQERQTRRLVVEIAEEAVRARGQAQVTEDLGVLLSGPHSESYRDFLLNKVSAPTLPAVNPYTNYSGSVVLRAVRITPQGAIVRLLERGALTLANPDNDPGVPEAEEYEYEHVVRFVFDNGLWTLVDDKIVNLPRSAAPIPLTRGIPLPPSTSPLFLPDAITPDSATEAYSFSRTSASNYALAYWSNYNTKYRSFSGNDCTNFVSQAMRYGGWSDVSPGWYNSTSYWWYTSSNQTLTWVNAHAWAIFTYNRPRASMAAYVSNLRIGDVLQADWQADKTIDHTMVVTAKSGSEIYLTYHSNNTKNKPFSTILKENPKAKWYGYLLSSSGN